MVSEYELYPERFESRGGLNDYLFRWVNLKALDGTLDSADPVKNRRQIIAHMQKDKGSEFLVNLLQAKGHGTQPQSFHEYVWVENGRALVFLAMTDKHSGSFEYELWYVRRDGTGLRRLTQLHDYLECVR